MIARFEPLLRLLCTLVHTEGVFNMIHHHESLTREENANGQSCGGGCDTRCHNGDSLSRGENANGQSCGGGNSCVLWSRAPFTYEGSGHGRGTYNSEDQLREFVDIKPIANRLVVFRSDVVPHQITDPPVLGILDSSCYCLFLLPRRIRVCIIGHCSALGQLSTLFGCNRCVRRCYLHTRCDVLWLSGGLANTSAQTGEQSVSSRHYTHASRQKQTGGSSRFKA
eukprot:2462880-Pyramimonas_sp.AAC.1